MTVNGRVTSSWAAKSYDELHWRLPLEVRTELNLSSVIFREELPVNDRLLEDYIDGLG